MEGIQDPIAFLAQPYGDEWDISLAVIRRARDIRMDQRREELKAIIPAIGNAVAKALAMSFKT